MKLGREIVRTCLAGIAVHFAVVTACSGVDTQPVLRLTGGPDSGSLPGASSGTGPDGSTPARQPQSDAGRGPSMLLPVAEAQAYESGARLKARWYVGADGTRQFIGWSDTQLGGGECYFTDSGDGTLRCIPLASAYTTAHFADAECEQLLFRMNTPACGEAVPTIARAYSQVIAHAPSAVASGECAQQFRYFQPGAKVVPQAVYAWNGSACVAQTVNPGGTYFAAGEELPLTAFVAGEIVVED